MKRKDAKDKFYGQDDVDIFEGGPAGQTLVDVDPFYGGIQRPEDQLIGDQFSRDTARLAKRIVEGLSPSPETQEEQADIRKKNQEALSALYSLTGVDPESFDGKMLASRIMRDRKLQELMGYDPGGLLTGGGTTERPTYGLFDVGSFFFGDARKGLTTMVDEGGKYKDLPFEQKLGIAILPIDLVDVVGVGALAKAPIGALMRAGVKTFGKNSKLTVKELVDNPEFMTKYLEENPNAARDLKEYGFDIEARYASGKKKRGPTPIERDQGFKILGRDFLQEQKQQTKKVEIDPKLEKAAKEADKVVADFSQNYEKAYGAGRNRVRQLMVLRKKVGSKEFDRLEKRAIKKGLSKKRNMAPAQTAGRKITTPAGDNFIQKNFGKMSKEELREAMTKDDATARKYFYTDAAGDVRMPGERFFMDYGTQQLGVLKDQSITGIGKGSKKEKDALLNREKIFAEFDVLTGAENFRANDPEQVRQAFSRAFSSQDTFSKYGGFDPLSTDVNYLRTLNRQIKAYNDSKGFGLFDPSKGFKKGRVYNKDEIQQINRFLKVGDETDRYRTSITNMYFKYLNTNDVYNNLKNNMQKLDNSFYPVINGKIKRDFTTKLKRYLDFVRQTSPNTKDPVKGDFSKFMNEFSGDINALLDPNSIEYKNFQKFSYYDKIREEVGELAKPFLNKRFPSKTDNPPKNSIQIAHTFESSQVGKTVGEGLEGAGMIPGSYYLDISELNAIQQPKLESRARAAYKEFNETGDRSKLDAVGEDLEKIGAQISVGEFTLGKHKSLEEKFIDLIGGPPGSPERKILKDKYGISDEEIVNLEKAIDLLNQGASSAGISQMQSGGLVGDVDDIFEEEKDLIQPRPRITIEFGDAAAGTLRRFGDEPTGEPKDMAVKDISAPAQKMFDVEPMEENMFAEPMSGNVETANLILPFYKLFTKPPINETAPIPTPKESLSNPTKKQKESLEQEKINKQDDVFDPTPEDNKNVDLGSSTDVAVTPKTNTAVTGVFYSDIERVLQRPDTPAIFPNKQVLLDLLRKNRIKNTEFDDYQLESLLRAYDDTTPIPKQQVIDHIRKAPIRGLHVHATGAGSNIINPGSRNIDTRYTGYAEAGFIPGSQRERVLYIPKENLRGDSGADPSTIFAGESINRHEFGIPNEADSYVVGWTRLTDRFAILPTKIEAPKTQSKVPGMTRERERLQRQVAGLYAEAINKLNREGVRRGLNQADLDEINQLSFEQMLTQYGDTLNELSPGLLDQIDELIVKVRDLDDEIAKGSTVDTSGIVKVAFADEIQSDIMQAAAGRKQKLLATVKKIQDEGRDSTTLPELSRVGKEALAFFEENKSVFRPLAKSETEVNLIGEQIAKADAEIDEIITRYIDTRELDPESIKRVQTLINENVQNLIDEIISIDTKTYDGLFPDLPFKKREEWADALIKKDLFELAYRKFVLKDPDVPDYYAVTPDELVIKRYNFKGNSATAQDLRDADKQRQIDRFTARGEFIGSEYKGIGMSEFYGGPNALSNVKDADGKAKHYTSVIEKILKNQAKSNNSEFTVLNVQTKSGGKDFFVVKDQNGNMVATLTNQEQARRLSGSNPNYRIETQRVPDSKSTTPSFAIKITEEMLEPYKTHKAKGGLVEMIDIFEVA